MLERLEKLKVELEKAKSKRAEWDARVKTLEKKVSEEEKTTVHEMVKAADLTPEELARLIAFSKNHIPGETPVEQIVNQESDTEESEDEE